MTQTAPFSLFRYVRTQALPSFSLFGYLNRWNDSMGTTLEEDAIESANQFLGKHGFEVGKHDGSKY